MSKKLEAGILGSVENNFEELRAIKNTSTTTRKWAVKPWPLPL